MTLADAAIFALLSVGAGLVCAWLIVLWRAR